MFAIPSAYVAIVAAVVLSAVFGVGVALAALANRVTGTPDKHLLLSSGLIAVMSYSSAAVFLLEALPPLRWTNLQPLDLRTTLWDHLGLLALLPAVSLVALWQFARRRKRENARVA